MQYGIDIFTQQESSTLTFSQCNMVLIYFTIHEYILQNSLRIFILRQKFCYYVLNYLYVEISRCVSRARHWCLPHCPGQVEFVNYSCVASENCILLAPLGKYVLYISWSAIQAYPRKYAFTCKNHILLGLIIGSTLVNEIL